MQIQLIYHKGGISVTVYARYTCQRTTWSWAYFFFSNEKQKEKKTTRMAIAKLFAFHANVRKGNCKVYCVTCKRKKIFQEVGYNLPLCFLIIFPEVSTLAILVVVNLLKVKIYFLSICHMNNARLCNFKDCSLSSVFWKWTSLVSLGNAICKT